MSQLKLYSLGVVVKDKLGFDNSILVSPVEVLNLQKEGSIHDYKKVFEGTIGNKAGESLNTEHTATMYVIAEWVKTGSSNRVTAPDVRAGETVMIYKYSDVEKYYWDDLKVERKLRRLEDVIYAYSNKPEADGEAFGEDSSYWIRVSTKEKFIKIHTSKSDSEPFSYDITLNTKEGYLEVTDDADNYITLNSKDGDLTASVVNDTTVNAGNDIVGIAGNNVDLQAGGSASITAGGDILGSADGSVTLEAGGDATIEAGGSITAEAGGSVTLKGSDVTLEGGTITLKGNITLDGPVSASQTVMAQIDVIGGGKSLAGCVC